MFAFLEHPDHPAALREHPELLDGAIEELLRRLPGLRLAIPADEVPLRDEMTVYGVQSLPVAWDASP
ncbi:hypothetical protein [Streptomyces sp. NPDC059850]|uniref:hypothetical protein n=1 Tax=Streptomyces sp. NPDC059850 TaxID=3346970 RepID=UPI003653F24B